MQGVTSPQSGTGILPGDSVCEPGYKFTLPWRARGASPLNSAVGEGSYRWSVKAIAIHTLFSRFGVLGSWQAEQVGYRLPWLFCTITAHPFPPCLAEAFMPGTLSVQTQDCPNWAQWSGDTNTWNLRQCRWGRMECFLLCVYHLTSVQANQPCPLCFEISALFPFHVLFHQVWTSYSMSAVDPH